MSGFGFLKTQNCYSFASLSESCLLYIQTSYWCSCHTAPVLTAEKSKSAGSQVTCGWINLLSPQSSVQRVAMQGVARVKPRPTPPAQLVLLSACLLVVRPVGHIDALSNLAAFMLNLVNSSSGSRKDFQWSIFVCHMLLTGQTGCCDIPAFDDHSALCNDVAAIVHVSGFPFLTSNPLFSLRTFPVTQ